MLGITAFVFSSSFSGTDTSTSLSLGSVVFGKSGCLASDDITLLEKDCSSFCLSLRVSLFFWVTISCFFIFSFSLKAIRELIIFFELIIKNWNILVVTSSAKLPVFSSIVPVKSRTAIHEKLNDNDDAGIIKITKNIKLPIKPKTPERLVKINLPR